MDAGRIDLSDPGDGRVQEKHRTDDTNDGDEKARPKDEEQNDLLFHRKSHVPQGGHRQGELERIL